MTRRIIDIILALIGAAVGAVAGYYTFWWILQQGLDALVLPGALVGCGAALLSRRGSKARGVLCAFVALGLGLYCEWSHRPFNADESLTYFVVHAHLIAPIRIIMIALGVLFAFWFGQGSVAALWAREKLPLKTQPPSEPHR